MLQVHIGNARYYNCSCARYVASDDRTSLTGLLIGFGLLLIIIIIIIVVVVVSYRIRCNKAHINGAALMEMDQSNRNYCVMPAAEAEINAIEYCNVGPVELDEKK